MWSLAEKWNKISFIGYLCGELNHCNYLENLECKTVKKSKSDIFLPLIRLILQYPKSYPETGDLVKALKFSWKHILTLKLSLKIPEFQLNSGVAKLHCSFSSLPEPVQIQWMFRPSDSATAQWREFPCAKKEEHKNCQWVSNLFGV